MIKIEICGGGGKWLITERRPFQWCMVHTYEDTTMENAIERYARMIIGKREEYRDAMARGPERREALSNN